MRCAQHTEHPLETGCVDDVTDSDEVEVAGGHPDDEIGLAHDSQYEVELVFTFDLTGFDVLDHGGPMIRVDHCFADCEGHIFIYPFRGFSVYHAEKPPNPAFALARGHIRGV